MNRTISLAALTVQMFRAHEASVLLIGHRRALISATSHRIGLTSYLGDTVAETEGSRHGVPSTSHYAICVDSLQRMDPRRRRYAVHAIASPALRLHIGTGAQPPHDGSCVDDDQLFHSCEKQSVRRYAPPWFR